MTHPAGAVLVCAVEGRDLTAAERSFYRTAGPSGVTVFTRNIPENPDDLIALTRALQSERPPGAPPFLVAIDQEGGRVARIRHPKFPNLGPAMKLAEGRSDAAGLETVRQHAGDVGRALAALGVNVNFAPVCDVLTEPSNLAIGDRAFATTAEPAALRAGAYLDGLQDTGVLGCLKHFPGQGAAKVDTHAGRAIVDVARDLLQNRELVPFIRLLPRVPMVMIAHCIYPSLAPEEASRSKAVIGGLLRQELGYRGVVVSDDMNMGALPQDDQAWSQAIVDAVAAGTDLLLVCRHLEKCQLAYDTLVREAAKSPAFARRLDEAASRVLPMRQRLV